MVRYVVKKTTYVVKNNLKHCACSLQTYKLALLKTPAHAVASILDVVKNKNGERYRSMSQLSKTTRLRSELTIAVVSTTRKLTLLKTTNRRC